jgi:hypothetical protein
MDTFQPVTSQVPYQRRSPPPPPPNLKTWSVLSHTLVSGNCGMMINLRNSLTNLLHCYMICSGIEQRTSAVKSQSSNSWYFFLYYAYYLYILCRIFIIVFIYLRVCLITYLFVYRWIHLVIYSLIASLIYILLEYVCFEYISPMYIYIYIMWKQFYCMAAKLGRSPVQSRKSCSPL